MCAWSERTFHDWVCHHSVVALVAVPAQREILKKAAVLSWSGVERRCMLLADLRRIKEGLVSPGVSRQVILPSPSTNLHVSGEACRSSRMFAIAKNRKFARPLARKGRANAFRFARDLGSWCFGLAETVLARGPR